MTGYVAQALNLIPQGLDDPPKWKLHATPGS